MNRIRLAALLALILASSLAQAHVQGGAWHTHGLRDGLLHPLTGLDHLLAMLAVGIWSVRQDSARWLPACFLAAMLIGVLSGVAGLVIPGLEAGVAVTVALLGLLLVAAVRLPDFAAGLMLAGFAVLHGNAHGAELPEVASTAGLMLSSAALIYAGRQLGQVIPPSLLQWTGAAIAATGAMLVTLA